MLSMLFRAQAEKELIVQDSMNLALLLHEARLEKFQAAVQLMRVLLTPLKKQDKISAELGVTVLKQLDKVTILNYQRHHFLIEQVNVKNLHKKIKNPKKYCGTLGWYKILNLAQILSNGKHSLKISTVASCLPRLFDQVFLFKKYKKFFQYKFYFKKFSR